MRVFLQLLVAVFVIQTCVSAQDGRQLTRDSGTAVTQKRLALVIGNGRYANVSPLDNPVNDANDMAAELQKLGFDVIKGTDTNLIQMRRLVREFGEKLEQSKGVGLFFYAGHGVEVRGKNFLVPVDADIAREVETEDHAIDVNSILRQMDAAGNGFNVVILDACRNNPFSRGWNRSGDTGGLANVLAPTGTYIAFAAAPGSTASDGKGTRNGTFTGALLKHLARPNLKLEEVFKATREDVMTLTGRKQVPWDSSSIQGDFYFRVSVELQTQPNTASGVSQPCPSPTPTPIAAAKNFDAIAWKDIGPLRVVLKSIRPLTLNDGRSGLKCDFDFINLEASKPIIVALNAVASDRSFPSIGTYLRSTLVDEGGGLWRLPNSDVGGMSIVGVGVQYPFGPYYNPAEIVKVLSKRDDLNSDVGKGTSAMGVVGEYRFIFGSTTEMSPGQNLTITMTFSQDANQTTPDAPSGIFHMATEIVVGSLTLGSKKSYTLYNLTFDRLSPRK